MAKERQCIFCGNTYEYCPHCGQYSKEPGWKFNFDSEKCHDLYEVIAGYNIGIKTIEDVKKVFNKYEVTDYSIFSKKLQDALNGVISQKKEESYKSDKKEENSKVETKEEKVEPEKKSEVPKKDNNFKSKKNKYNFERRANAEE